MIRRTGRASPWWERTLQTFGLLLGALSVVGMHQLSIGHTLSNTPDTTAAPMAAMGSGAHHADKSRQLSDSPASTYTAASSADQPVTTVGNPLQDTARLHLGDAGPTATPLLSGAHFAVDGCTGCGGHAMSSLACLLAPTLLVLLVPHQPPRSTLVPMFLRTPRPVPVMSWGRPRRPLSLVELSLRRT